MRFVVDEFQNALVRLPWAGTPPASHLKTDKYPGKEEKNHVAQLGYRYQDQDEYIYGASFGAGLKYPLGEETTITLEYSWNETDTFDDNQFFTVKMDF